MSANRRHPPEPAYTWRYAGWFAVQMLWMIPAGMLLLTVAATVGMTVISAAGGP